MGKKRKNLFSKIVMLIFLGMIVLGFSIPGFLNSGESAAPTYVEPRVCQTDSDCYLICDDAPRKAFCWQNLCQQNSCDESSFFPYKDAPITFSIDFDLAGDSPNLPERANEKNLFTTFQDNSVAVYSTGLTLNQILEKVSITVDSTCVTVGEEESCGNITLKVNEEENYIYGDYTPKQGDAISIILSES